MTLLDAGVGRRVKVIGRGPDLDEVAGLGIHLGDEVVVVREAPFAGPLLVEVPASGVRVALARRMARDIRVEPAHG